MRRTTTARLGRVAVVLSLLVGLLGVLAPMAPAAAQDADGGHDQALEIAAMPDGRLVVLRIADRDLGSGVVNLLVVSRLLPTGAPDPTFGDGGSTVLRFGTHPISGGRLVLSPDGSVTVFSLTQRFALILGLLAARLDSTGQPDVAWGDPAVGPGLRRIDVGQVPGSFPQIALTADLGPHGDPVAMVWASTSPAHATRVYRALPTLHLDERFSGDGVLESEVPLPHHVDASGRWLSLEVGNEYGAGGGPLHTIYRITRRTPAGAPDTTFGPTGVATIGLPPPSRDVGSYDLTELGGDLVVADHLGFFRVDETGHLRTSIGDDGVVPVAVGGRVTLSTLGADLVLAGQPGRECVRVHRRTGDGAPVAAWSGDGQADVCTGAFSSTLADTVVVGDTTYVLTTSVDEQDEDDRVTVTALGPDGQPRSSFGGDGEVDVLFAAPVGPFPSAAPTSVTVESGWQFLTVRWAPPAHSGGAPVLRYLLVAQTASGEVVRTGVAPADARVHSLDLLQHDTPYTVTVVPITSAGLGAGAVLSGTPSRTGLFFRLPGIPRDVQATRSGSTASVSWRPPTDDGGRPLDSYHVLAVQKDPATGDTLRDWVGVDPLTQTAVVKHLRPGQPTYVFVLAHSGWGWGYMHMVAVP